MLIDHADDHYPIQSWAIDSCTTEVIIEHPYKGEYISIWKFILGFAEAQRCNAVFIRYPIWKVNTLNERVMNINYSNKYILPGIELILFDLNIISDTLNYLYITKYLCYYMPLFALQVKRTACIPRLAAMVHL